MPHLSEKDIAEILAGTPPHIREMRAKRAAKRAAAKPAVVAVVSEKFAQAAKANPESVRLTAKAVDDTIVMERPRRTEAIQVLEVDAQGRPALGLRHDFTTNERHLVEFDQGYRRTGVISDYSPLDGLRRRDDE
jgi:hypothetical protein